jgi:AcrR family transcriptional regulator
MPRIVNHDERRRDLARAVWTLMREEGLEAVTIRAVAERSGWSSGAVRHYLTNREAIITFAAEQIRSEFAEHLRSRPITGDPLRDLRSLMLAVLPLTENTKSMMEIWLAFVGAAVSRKSFAERASVYGDLHDFLIEHLTAVAAVGRISPADVPTLGIEGHALVDGLAGHRLLEQITDQDAETAIDNWLRRAIPMG